MNVWRRALTFNNEIPALVDDCQGAKVVHNGLVVRWSGYTRLSGKVQQQSPSQCGSTFNRRQCLHTAIDDANRQVEKEIYNKTRLFFSCDSKDKVAPVAESCPKEIFITTPLKEVNITWREPTFIDNGRIDKVEHNLRPGQVITKGYSRIYDKLLGFHLGRLQRRLRGDGQCLECGHVRVQSARLERLLP